ncbi:copper chaperone PCu(A)C [Methylopila musalis]|uniref:Copper chaperone PCu(A)C n=1 Tax=Methylopila musalis TaxID=1134781 RepID=A0ABW3Z623_9HYPH
MKRTFPALALAVAALVAGGNPIAAHDYKAGAITIDHPWSRATPKGARVAGGYLTLRNGGAEADRLLSVSSDIAARTEIHEMSTANGTMTMRPLPEGVPAPAHGEVAFKPGGFHIMFFDLKRPLEKGERFAGRLTFEKAGPVDVEFSVEAIGAAAPGGAATAPATPEAKDGHAH